MTDHRNDPIRYRQCVEDWRWLQAEAEAQDHRMREDDLTMRPRNYRPGNMVVVAIVLGAAALIGALVLEHYLRGAS